MYFSDNISFYLWRRIVLIFILISFDRSADALEDEQEGEKHETSGRNSNINGAQDIVFVIISQSDVYHATKSEELRQSILKQVSSVKEDPPVIRMVHEEFSNIGAWTLVPLLPWLAKLHSRDTSWITFLEEKTRVNVKELIGVLEEYNPKEDVWMGRGLHDEESSIIHHFAFANNPTAFKYPLLAAGFVMSTSLIKRLVKDKNSPNTDFSIDASHEFALYVGKPLLNLPDSFCLENQKGCAAFPSKFTRCSEPVPVDAIFFAVKTCFKFHNDRIPVVKNTWGGDAKHIEFFSHLKDDRIPTTDVGVKNTERGHCEKMFAIFRMVLDRSRQIPSLQWMILADDDTLLSVPRLQDLLTCWNSSEPVAIGERYGYNVKSNVPGGYNYLTGGGSIAISVISLKFILQHCSCHTADTPDDMYLGICLARLNIPIVHSPDFHQARPDDYATDYLAVQTPVSFHKHWMIDPVSTYKEWFKEPNDIHKHSEL